MIVGIPRALLYYKYEILWQAFFKYLGIKIVISPNTNKKILKKGIKNSIDESCLSSKIFMGHVEYLSDKCDVIFIPRIASLCKKEETCAKFWALPDIVQNTFPNLEILTCDIDYQNGKKLEEAFIKLGTSLNIKRNIVLKAYKFAQEKNNDILVSKIKKQEMLFSKDGLKILIVSHPYNIYDEYVGHPIIKYLEKLNIIPIMADIAPIKESRKKSKKISKTLYWTDNKQLVGAIQLYKDLVDGILIVSSFPCGPDSIVNDLVLRKVKDIPITVIVVDELQGIAGIETRLESFVDILTLRKE